MKKKDLIGLIMAGGEGRRMGLREEKPLIEIEGKPMIQHVVKTLKNVEEIEEIAVVTTDCTPKTHNMAQKLSLRVMKTSGGGYIPDMQEAIRKINFRVALVISSDLPLVTKETLGLILSKFRESWKPALSVFVPLDTLRELGLEPHRKYELDNREVSPVGINIVETERIDENHIEQEDLILSRPELALNVNDEKRLSIAKKRFSEGSSA